MKLSRFDIDDPAFLRDHFSLPPMPEVASKLMEQIASGEATADGIWFRHPTRWHLLIV